MLLKNKFQLFALLSLIALLLISGFIIFQLWTQLSPVEQATLQDVTKRYLAYLFIGGFVLVVALGLAFDLVFNSYVLPLKRTIAELTLVSTVNPSHRLKIEGSQDIEKLAQLINELAEKATVSEDSVNETVRQVKQEIEEERNRLAAVIGGLPEGVVICNINGRILLYNQKARSLLSKQRIDHTEQVNSIDMLGLGRSIFTVLNRNLIVHVIDELTNRHGNATHQAGYHFAFINDNDQMLNIRAIPILTAEKAINGFVLVIYDITQKLSNAVLREKYLDLLVTSVRSSISSIRAAVETIIDFPDITGEALTKLQKVILEESLTLTNRIDQPEMKDLLGLNQEWPMEDLQCSDLLRVIQNKAETTLGVQIFVDAAEANLWTRLDSYTMVHSILFLISRIKDRIQPESFLCQVENTGQSVNFELAWQGSPVTPEMLREWKSERLVFGDETVPLTLREIIEHHQTDIWPQSAADNRSCLRMLLPLSQATEVKYERKSAITLENRPEFYDFNFFDQIGLRPEQENRSLKELHYTVFDTETTGLNPREDEIISIGALRVVNGRLLREESFDRLINPNRSLSTASIKIHGIQPDMLTGQPDISVTLPMFQRFVEDTVLVAHNAAFDMRMLQVKEDATGIAFRNPVLDTLLLSAVIHPAHQDHNMDEIAKRLGVRVIGRHTALGDAMVTAELFLKMIPLLEKIGIFTLKQAIDASRKTYYARLKY